LFELVNFSASGTALIRDVPQHMIARGIRR
jgi:hypothetical protein